MTAVFLMMAHEPRLITTNLYRCVVPIDLNRTQLLQCKMHNVTTLMLVARFHCNAPAVSRPARRAS